MKGLILSEEYYHQFGTKMIEEIFPKYKEKIAAGLAGDGSECYGFDDEISRDHDWGLRFLPVAYEGRLPGNWAGTSLGL